MGTVRSVIADRDLGDRAEITDVINLYGRGVATRDTDLLVSIFTEDAELDYYGSDLVKGRDAIRAKFGGALTTADRNHAPMPLDERLVSVPLMTNILIELDGDTARAESYCLATHAGPRAGEGRVLLRATRNLDDLARTGAGWKIARRRHELLWSIDVPGEAGVVHQPVRTAE